MHNTRRTASSPRLTAQRPKRRYLSGLLALALAAPVAAAPGLASAAPAPQFPFQNPQLSLSTRVDDLLGRLTLDEKIGFLHQYQPEIPRLGIKLFKAGTEALHGVAWTNDHANNGNVVTAQGTVFPQAVGLASTWDTALIKQVGNAVGQEARGYNAIDPRVWGTNLWAPVVNLLRDPRWGRNEEGYSEDPTLTGAISTAYGLGIEGNDPFYLQAAPTLKHYLANNNEVHRDTTSSNLPARVLHEYDQKAFQPAIAANAATGVMASYNLVNGRPNTVSQDLNDVVRKWTDKPLFNVSDAFAPYNLTGSQAYFGSQPEADAALFKAGLDSFTADNNNPQPMTDAIKTALAQGLITVADIDTSVRHALELRFRLGDFDPDGGPYAKITPAVINNPAHQQLNRKAADEAMVLLKNSGNALPLNPTRTKKVAVVGPLANTLYTDWYSGALPYGVTPLAGITQRLGAGASVTSSEGVDRIALKDVSTGKYVTAGTGPTGAILAEGGTTATANTQFDAFDWGQGVLALRSVANGKYLGYNFDPAVFRNDQAQPNNWFVQQQFKLEQRPNGNVVIRYAGYEAAFDWSQPFRTPYLTVQPDGTLNLGAATADAATEFSKETLTSGVDSAVAAARGADAAVVVVGSMPFINGREDHDRSTMDLAAAQHALVQAVRQANPNTIVVLQNSYPDTIGWEQQNVPAILWTTHAGAETGHALADVLFGDVSPSGRLTQTWYQSTSDLPDILDYDIIKDNRTYLYYQGTPLYPFGHGLTYTTFKYSNLRLSSGSVDPAGTVTVSVDVRNTGTRASDEVVQLYTHQRTSRVKQPVKQLRAFSRVSLAPGQTKTVQLRLKAADLAFWDVTRSRSVVEASTQDIMVGSSSTDIRARGTLQVRGEVIPARSLATLTRAENFDSYQGATLAPETKLRGTSVSAAAGNWIGFSGVDLRAGAVSITAKVARAAAGASSIQIRLDDPVHGRLAGTLPVSSTGDVFTYATATAVLHGAWGMHDVYLVATGDVRVSTFSLNQRR
ncbi:MAG TPA: glycoside hydrolase family 3 C-terminal domain-containing protein [Mycobacteriales bacterium]|nr:glycoside hydrolase family 3 C-terminal domain-containing protein [Mycobacteriales bacterium]